MNQARLAVNTAINNSTSNMMRSMQMCQCTPDVPCCLPPEPLLAPNR